jgi:hypothetical protein
MPHIRARVATTHPLSVYGGIALAESAAEDMAIQLRGGTVPMTFNHNADRVLTVSVLDTGTETLEDGHLAVWMEFDMPDGEWAAVDQEVRESGALGGFSYTTLDSVSGDEQTADIEIAADVSHFTEVQIEAAADALRVDYGVWSARVFQFSHVVDAAVILSFAASVVQQVPANVLSELILNTAKRFLRPSGPSVFNLRVKATPKRFVGKVRIVTDDPEELKRQIAKVPSVFRAALDDIRDQGDSR